MAGQRWSRSAAGVAVAMMMVGLVASAVATEISAGAGELEVKKGIFSQGRWYGGISGGWISTSGDDYLSLGLGVAYNLADGLSAGANYEAWLIGDPLVQKLSPWLGYTFWQAGRVKPYVAAFWRQNWVSGYDDYQDVGARFGAYVAQGRSYLGVGMVYEYRLDDQGFYDQDRWYPEFRYAVGF